MESSCASRYGPPMRILQPALLLLALACPAASAAPQDTLRIGTKEAAPFSFKGEDGEWRGLSIDLWRDVAGDLELDYTFVEAPLTELISGVTDGRFDASVAALTVTPEREEVADFTHSILPSGLGIAVPAEEGSGLLAVLSNLFTVDFFKAVGTLVLVLFLGGAVMWLLERRKNPEQFGGSAGQGLGSAFWWSAVTMTTVGYGDKAPVTGAGRLIGVIWMFAGVITISGLTAAIASTLTVSRLEHAVKGPEDLPGLGRLAAVAGSTGEDYLRGERLGHRAFESAEVAMEALAKGRVKAVIYDAPILRYLANQRFQGSVRVLPVTFERQDYAFALPLGSELRKPLNQALLERIGSQEWEDTKFEYLGGSE